MLTIYMENPEIPVGKSNGTHHSIWTRKTYERLKIKKVKHYFEKEIPSHFLKKQKKKKRINVKGPCQGLSRSEFLK